MALALFDLDNTLLEGDSDYLWGVFLVEQGLVDGSIYEEANRRFYQQYADGELDIHEFLNFSLNPLTQIDPSKLEQLHEQFMEQHIRPIMTTKGQAAIDRHKEAGDTTMIITATNRFVTEPIAEAFGVEHLIATEPEIIDGRYTGKVSGVPSYQEGKITRLNDWLASNDESLEGSTFYSDSHNDLPLLKTVTKPIAVDPDKILEKYARDSGWQISSFR